MKVLLFVSRYCHLMWININYFLVLLINKPITLYLTRTASFVYTIVWFIHWVWIVHLPDNCMGWNGLYFYCETIYNPYNINLEVFCWSHVAVIFELYFCFLGLWKECVGPAVCRFSWLQHWTCCSLQGTVSTKSTFFYGLQ